MNFRELFRQLSWNGRSLRARRYKDLYLPLERTNEALARDEDYVNSAVEQVEDLLHYLPLSDQSRVLDFGCGQGRFANGLLIRAPQIGSYCGIDTNKNSIRWCRRWLQRFHPNFTFIHLPAHNARYNPGAKSLLPLPLPANAFEVAFLNSVFSHMLTADVQFYLAQLHSVLCDAGIIYLTAFIETNVPNVIENPAGYLGKEAAGALHRVRYEQSFFLSLVAQVGFQLVDFRHRHVARTQQSLVVARK